MPDDINNERPVTNHFKVIISLNSFAAHSSLPIFVNALHTHDSVSLAVLKIEN